MVDRIDGLITPPGTQPNTQTSRQGSPAGEARPAPSERPPATPETDSVSLTESARQLSELASEASSGDAVDIGRVEDVRQAIDDGTYQINPQQIAERLLATEDSIGE